MQPKKSSKTNQSISKYFLKKPYGTHTHTEVGGSFFKERYAKVAKFPNSHREKKTLVGQQTFKRKKKGEQYLRHTMLEYDRFLSFLDLLESASDVKPELSLRGGGYSRLENIA